MLGSYTQFQSKSTQNNPLTGASQFVTTVNTLLNYYGQWINIGEMIFTNQHHASHCWSNSTFSPIRIRQHGRTVLKHVRNPANDPSSDFDKMELTKNPFYYYHFILILSWTNIYSHYEASDDIHPTFYCDKLPMQGMELTFVFERGPW